MSINIMKPVVNVFIFRRDLRIHDNNALYELFKYDPSVPVMPIFIFNPLQIEKGKNDHYNASAVQFMIESLKDLSEQCKESLRYFHGYDIPIMEQLLKGFIINAIGFNKDYTPYAKTRDEQLIKWCEQRGIPLLASEDYSLFPMNSILTDTQKPYEVFTPFYKKCLKKANTVPQPVTINDIKFYKGKVQNVVRNIDAYIQDKTTNEMKGGRESALKILKRVERREFVNYDTVRDFPARDGTTKLSAYLKFGCISVREAYYTAKKAYGINHGLVRELIWKEFYSHIVYHFPKILQGQIGGANQPFKAKYNDVQWRNNNGEFEKWCQGKTGYPLVDAGMRQMNASGWMHNRCRMVVAMFLTKDLMMDWRKGEKYFAKKLCDYDPCSNNGGWQWCSSTGTDAQPYFRVLSPILQAERFDKNAEFIKKWIPELRNVPAKDILNWEVACDKYPNVQYPRPMVIHKEQMKSLHELFAHQNIKK